MGKMTILDYPCAILGLSFGDVLVHEEQDGTVDSADSLPHNSGSE